MINNEAAKADNGARKTAAEPAVKAILFRIVIEKGRKNRIHTGYKG